MPRDGRKHPVRFRAENHGPILRTVWDFGDGTVVTNQPFTSHAWLAPGTCTVRLTGYNDSHPEGVVTSSQIQVIEAVHYVNGGNPTPVFPYTSWATAATSIQDAVNAGIVVGRLVLVTNGVYRTGGVQADGANRVALANTVLQSVNGPEVTIIDGAGGARCVALGGEAILSGFTLRNGLTQWRGSIWEVPMIRETGNGGGLAAGDFAIATNCVLTGNRATWGGGACGGTLCNCTLTGNSANHTWLDCAPVGGAGGGAYGST